MPSPSPKRLYLLRHGQSAANAGEVTHDPALIPLTAQGQCQAQALAMDWEQRPAAIVTSAYERAKDTAQPLCTRWGITAQRHPGLHEFVTLSPPAVAGTDVQMRKPLVDAYWTAADPHFCHGPGAETFVQFAQRVQAFRQTLHTLADTTLIIGHGMWFAMLIWQLQGFGYQDSLAMQAFRQYQLALPMPNAAVYALYSQGGEAWAVRFDEARYRRLAALMER